MTENTITLALSLPADFAKVIDPAELTEEQRVGFIFGWKDAGGYVGDLDSPRPWCCPWLYSDELEVVGATPYDWGFDYWKQTENEFALLMAFEAESEA